MRCIVGWYGGLPRARQHPTRLWHAELRGAKVGAEYTVPTWNFALATARLGVTGEGRGADNGEGVPLLHPDYQMVQGDGTGPIASRAPSGRWLQVVNWGSRRPRMPHPIDDRACRTRSIHTLRFLLEWLRPPAAVYVCTYICPSIHPQTDERTEMNDRTKQEAHYNRSMNE